jgi:hypothetical protein
MVEGDTRFDQAQDSLVEVVWFMKCVFGRTYVPQIIVRKDRNPVLGTRGSGAIS